MSVNLLKNLDFGAKINAVEAITESGKEMLKNYRAYMYSNAASCGLVNGFISEAQKYSFDSGVMQILSSVSEYVNENNISWKLATACESITANNSSYNYIAKVGVQQVEKLLEMNESEVVQYIKGGILKPVQYIPEFRAICKEVFKTAVNEVHTNTYNVTCPLSYVVVSENAQYFNVLGNTYKIAEGKVEHVRFDNAEFNEINSLLPNFKHVDESLVYAYKPNYASDEYKFTLNENSIEFTKGSYTQTYENAADFLQDADIFSRQLFMAEKYQYLSTAANIAKVFEHMDSIVLVDCANVVESSNGTILAIVEAENDVNLTVVRSYGAGASSNNFQYMTEALEQVQKIAGVDLKGLYENRINEDCKKQDPNSYNSIQEQLAASKSEKMDIRKKKIAFLAEQYKNDPVKIALLNNIAKELSMLED